MYQGKIAVKKKQQNGAGYTGLVLGFVIAAMATMEPWPFWVALSLMVVGIAWGGVYAFKHKDELEERPAVCFGDVLAMAGATIVGYHVAAAWLATIGL